jgi:hypothetical protein
MECSISSAAGWEISGIVLGERGTHGWHRAAMPLRSCQWTKIVWTWKNAYYNSGESLLHGCQTAELRIDRGSICQLKYREVQGRSSSLLDPVTSQSITVLRLSRRKICLGEALNLWPQCFEQKTLSNHKCLRTVSLRVLDPYCVSTGSETVRPRCWRLFEE